MPRDKAKGRMMDSGGMPVTDLVQVLSKHPKTERDVWNQP